MLNGRDDAMMMQVAISMVHPQHADRHVLKLSLKSLFLRVLLCTNISCGLVVLLFYIWTLWQF